MSANSTTPTTGAGITPTSSLVTSISSLSTSDTSTTSPTTTSTPQPITTTTPPTTTTTTPIITSTPSPTSETVVITSVVSDSQGQSVVTITKTSVIEPTNTVDPASTTSSGAAGNLAQGGNQGGGGGGVDASKVAPAVVVPVVVIALLIFGGIWFFRRRRANKEAQELRRKEAEEYGFNPNTDPGFGGSAVAGTTATNDNAAAMSEVDGSGYRGWGTTNTARKASTTLGSASVGAAAAAGLARSDSGENGAYHSNGQPSPNGPNGNAASYSDHNSGDPLVHQSRPISQDFEGVAALGAGPAAGSRNNGGVHRGPSNASSAYSGGQRSDTSGEIGTAIGSPTWGNEYLPEDGPYGAPGGGAAPVIRDVSARRNTRIEQPAVMPQQARGGISQNF